LTVGRVARDSEVYSLVAGPYTVLLETESPDSLAPRGIGFAAGEMTASGTLRLTGRLGDGKAFSLAMRFAENGTAPIYLWRKIAAANSQGLSRSKTRNSAARCAGGDQQELQRDSIRRLHCAARRTRSLRKEHRFFPAGPRPRRTAGFSLGDVVAGRFTLGLDRVSHFSPPNDAGSNSRFRSANRIVQRHLPLGRRGQDHDFLRRLVAR
jgi:hypothetical protein